MIKQPGKIVITGGSGFLGHEIFRYLSFKYHVISLTSKKNISRSHSRIFKTIDWDNLESISEHLLDAELVIHCAGMSSSACAENIEKAIEFNGLQTKKFISLCIANNVKRFFYLSSIHVYRKPLKGIIKENNPTGNSHPYAFTKILAENIVLYETAGTNTKGYILRLSNIFGPHSFKNQNLWSLVVNDFCVQAHKTKKIIITGSGKDLRDFLPLSGFLEQILYLTQNRDSCLPVMNISSGCTFSIMDIALLVQKKFKELLYEEPELIVLKNSPLKTEIERFIIKPSLDKIFKYDNHDIEEEIASVINYLENERI